MGDMFLNGRRYGTGTVYKEVTQAEYNALPASKLTDNIMYCVKDAPGSGQGFPPLIYSDEEREVGVWRDGRPLYQKSFIKTVNISDNSGGTQLLDLDIYSVVNEYIRVEASLYGTVIMPRNRIKSTWSESVFCSEDKIYIEAAHQISNAKLYVTVLYTKTTDTPGSSIWSTDVGNRGKFFHGAGEILTGESNDPIRGYGDFTAVCENGIAKIDFYVRTTVAGSGSSQFSYGIQVSKLKEIAPSLPDITPLRGGIWKSTLGIETYEHFGTLFEVGPSWWIPARYYTQNGDQGAWPASTWTVGRPIWGTLYGTYD